MPRTQWRRIVDDDEEMPGPSRGRRRRINSDSDDEIPAWTQSQKSQGRKKRHVENGTGNGDYDYDNQSQLTQSKSKNGPSEYELKQLMERVVRYILVSDRSRHPIQRQNIQKSVLDGSKHFRAVMEHTASTLKKVFGYELVSIENGKYILVNGIINETPHLSFPTERTPMVILFLALSHIFMNEEQCSEESLWNLFRKLNIVEGDDFRHEHFGDVHHWITVEFVKQRYLIRSKVENSDPQKFLYEWGPRAELELNKLDVLRFVSRVYGDKPLKTWPNQYKVATESQMQEDEP